MLRSLMTAASGMKAQQMQVDTIANNIANANTHGFKKSRLSFRSLLYETIREPGAPVGGTQMDATGLQIGTGTEIAGSYKNFAQGGLEFTDNALDLAIEGDGFFKVQLPDGSDRYTRNGSFRIDGNGQVVTTEGYLVQPAVTIPAESVGIAVSADGVVSYTTGPGEPLEQAGQLLLTRFANPAGLKSQGGSYFSETASSGTPTDTPPATAGAGTIHSKHLERSNVATVDELVGLIVAQRNYEVNSRAIKVSDQMLQEVNQLIR